MQQDGLFLCILKGESRSPSRLDSGTESRPHRNKMMISQITTKVRSAVNYAAHKLLNGRENWHRLADQYTEEASELIVALSHLDRDRISMFYVVDEMADVIVSLDSLIEQLSKEDQALLVARIEYKVTRLNDRLASRVNQLQKVGGLPFLVMDAA